MGTKSRGSKSGRVMDPLSPKGHGLSQDRIDLHTLGEDGELPPRSSRRIGSATLSELGDDSAPAEATVDATAN